MNIYRLNTVIATVHPSDDSAYSCKLMGDNIVRLNFRLTAAIDLRIGDHILWTGQIFTLNTQPVIREVSSREVEYNCEFQGIDYELPKTGYKLFDNTSIPLNTEFSLSGKALTFVRLIVDNLNRNGEDWTVGNVIDTELKTLDFSGENCFGVLQRLATEFETEYFISSTKTISLCKKGFDGEVIALSYGMGNGLKWIRRINRDTDPVVTCLFAYGANKNIPYGYRNGATRLMLPDGEYLLQNVSLYGVREGDKIFEEVYPRLNAGSSNDPGIVTAVTGALKFSDANLDFDVNDTLTAETAKVVFNTGELAGYEFEVQTYDAATKTYTIIATEYDGMTLPTANICAAVGDKYVLINIKMPEAYVTRAELELAEKAVEYLAEVSKIRDSFNSECDILYFKNNHIALEIAQVIRIQSTILNVDREIRVLGFVQTINEPFKYDIEFGEKPSTGKIEKLSTDLTNTASAVASTQKLNWQTTLELLALIKGANSPSDFSNLTGLPTNNDALSKYLNAFPDAKSEINSGAIVWDHDLTYQATEIEYKILGVPYTSKAQEITLSAADPNLSRIDTFYVDMFGNLNVATGIPAVNPTSTILNSVQLEVMTVLVGPGSTEPSDLNIARIYDENVIEEWVNSASVDPYVSVAFNSADSPRIGDKRIKVSINVPNTVVASPLHFPGEKYGGGIIIHLSPSGKSGLIVAENDTAADVFYSKLSGVSNYTTGATNAAIGSGQANTDLMLANDAAKDFAAKYCADLIVDTDYTDWYLPSELELALIYFHRFKIGNLGTKTYWSSTEAGWNKARCISFSNGVAYTRDKNNRYCVRAIRSFDDNSLTNNKPVATLTPLNTRMTFATDTPVGVKDGVLSLFVKSTLAWKVNSMLLIESYLGATKTGSCVVSPSTNKYGYKSEDDQWQLIAIQMTNFNSSRDTLDCFKISLVGSWTNKIDFGIDVIRYQFSKIELKKESETITDYRFNEDYDGVRTEFTTSKPYKPGTTQLTRNGVRQFIGASADYTESNGKILLNYAPLYYEKFICTYKTI